MKHFVFLTISSKTYCGDGQRKTELQLEDQVKEQHDNMARTKQNLYLK